MHRHILLELPSTKFHEYSLSGLRVLTWEQTLEVNRLNFATSFTNVPETFHRLRGCELDWTDAGWVTVNARLNLRVVQGRANKFRDSFFISRRAM